MLVSIYTPTHDPKWLQRAWQSLKAQTHAEFEWILVPNGECETLPTSITGDSRVRVFPAREHTGRIGALKAHAVDHARGELLFELDHDDALPRNALERVVAKADPDRAQFFYSDFATVSNDYHPVVYSKDYGWETYDWTHGGRRLKASRAFEPSPVALSNLQFGPNHLRAWTRKAYRAVDGYDRELAVADDYDLVVRSWLAGTEFVYIPECLYLYFSHPQATSIVLNEKIQQLQAELALKHQDAINNEWCRRKDLETYELCISSGQETPYKQLFPLNGVERIKDGDFRFPGLSDLPPDSVGQLYCRHLLPYLRPEMIESFFAECFRVLAPAGWLRCLYPTTDGRGAFMNPLYRSYWNPCTFWMFTRRHYAELAGGVRSRFYLARAWDVWLDEQNKAAKLLHSWADLVALKGQRQPGWVDI